MSNLFTVFFTNEYQACTCILVLGLYKIASSPDLVKKQFPFPEDTPFFT